MMDFGVTQCCMVEDTQVSAKFFPTGLLPSVDLYIENVLLVVQMQSQWTMIIAESITAQESNDPTNNC